MTGILHELTNLASSWMLIYAAHSTVLLGTAWLASRALGRRAPALRETLWKTALTAGLLTATIQTALKTSPPERLASAATPAVAEPMALSAAATPPLTSTMGELLGDDRQLAEAGQPAAITPMASDKGAWDVRLLLASSWLAIGGALCLWLAFAYAGLARRLRGRAAIESGLLPDQLARLVSGQKTPRIRLTRSSRLKTPLAMGVFRPEICVPERAMRELDAEQTESMLAHEAAHHLYRDPLWLMLARVLESALFFQPLNRVARKALQDLAELRCDDWAASRTGRPLALARCLTEVASWHVGSPSLAPGMARQGKLLHSRVSRLADHDAVSTRRPLPKWAALLAALTLCVTVAAAPNWDGQVPAAPAPPSEPTPPVAVEPAPKAEPAPLVRPEPAVAPTPDTEPAPLVRPEPAVAPTPDEEPAPAVEPSPPALPTKATAPAPKSRPAPPAPVAPSRDDEAWQDEEWDEEDEKDEKDERRDARQEAMEERMEAMVERFEEALERSEERFETMIEALEDRVEARFENSDDDAAEEAFDAKLEAFEDRMEDALELLEDKADDLLDSYEDKLDLSGDLSEGHMSRIAETLELDLSNLRTEHEALVKRLELEFEKLYAQY